MSGAGTHGRATSGARHLRPALVVGALVAALGLGAYAWASTAGANARAQAAAAAPRGAHESQGHERWSKVSHERSSKTVGKAKAQVAPATSIGQLSGASEPAPLAPNGTYTTPSGKTATIAGLRGAPTMVWFVAGGCASCEASIPAVAAHFRELARSGLRVLTLGLYGAFPPGKAGAEAVLSFGEAAAGKGAATQPGWLWGVASEQLSLAYDPTGIPDLYVLVGPSGHIRYRGNAPVSTMSELVAQAKRLAARREATVALPPCCP